MVSNAVDQLIKEAENLKARAKTSDDYQQLAKIWGRALAVDCTAGVERGCAGEAWAAWRRALALAAPAHQPALRLALLGYYTSLVHAINKGVGAGCGEGGGGGSGGGVRYMRAEGLARSGDVARWVGAPAAARRLYLRAAATYPAAGHAYSQVALVCGAGAGAGAATGGAAWRRALERVYWSCRALAAPAPFPPAAANLPRCLAAAPPPPAAAAGTAAPPYPARLLHAAHLLHAMQLRGEESVSALMSLGDAADLTPQLLVQCAVIVCVVCGEAAGGRQQAGGEAAGAGGGAGGSSMALRGAGALAAAFLRALASHPATQLTHPALKVCLEWLCWAGAGVRGATLGRARVCCALAAALPSPAPTAPAPCPPAPLPEELHLEGFQPVLAAHAYYRECERESAADGVEKGPAAEEGAAASEPVAAPVVVAVAAPVENGDGDAARGDTAAEGGAGERDGACERDSGDAGERGRRSARLVALGTRLARLHPDRLRRTEEGAWWGAAEALPGCVAPPTVISEASFREQVLGARGGILKPQGSLERARARAGAGAGSAGGGGGGAGTGSGGAGEGRRAFTNVAMAAILRAGADDHAKQVKWQGPLPLLSPREIDVRQLGPPHQQRFPAAALSPSPHQPQHAYRPPQPPYSPPSYPPPTHHHQQLSPQHQQLSPQHQHLSPQHQHLSPHHQHLSPQHQQLQHQHQPPQYQHQPPQYQPQPPQYQHQLQHLQLYQQQPPHSPLHQRQPLQEAGMLGERRGAGAGVGGQSAAPPAQPAQPAQLAQPALYSLFSPPPHMHQDALERLRHHRQ